MLSVSTWNFISQSVVYYIPWTKIYNDNNMPDRGSKMLNLKTHQIKLDNQWNYNGVKKSRCCIKVHCVTYTRSLSGQYPQCDQKINAIPYSYIDWSWTYNNTYLLWWRYYGIITIFLKTDQGGRGKFLFKQRMVCLKFQEMTAVAQYSLLNKPRHKLKFIDMLKAQFL